MALLQPEAVPATMLCLTLPMTTLMALRERHSIDTTGFAWITIGRVLGTACGLWLLLFLPEGSLSKLFGILIILSVVVSIISPPYNVRRVHRFVGGVASGTMSTTASLGGPPLALIYQRSSGSELRSTLSISFVIGLFMSLTALALAGQIESSHILLALKMAPGMLLGLAASTLVASRFDERYLRPAILIFAAVAGLAVLVTS